MRPALYAALFVSVGSLSCGEAPQAGEECACTGAACQEGRCALRVINECPEQWGAARVFLTDTGPDAQPAGVSASGAPFEDCQGFAVGEGFMFIVEAEDARTISETAGATFQCDGSRPFEFKLVCRR